MRIELDEETKRLLKTLDVSVYTEDNRFELPNPIPKVIPTELDRPLTIQEQIQRIVRINISRQAEKNEMESWDEANDFDIPDETEMSSPYEYSEMQEEFIKQIQEPEVPKEEKEEADQRPPANEAGEDPPE